ncbi:MAG: hypothetical protein IJ859_05490, partial [Synergistaceae bacterium]|nr:hypothetical protein [Synergistaceae bacterium]
EGKLQGTCDFQDSKLIISGRYDALIFNPERLEARLFEFKGFSKSDITVPLSQSLIYAWLIQKSSGIIPSIEIIYLAEQHPDVFDFNVVKDMIVSGLPGLFRSAVDIILLRRLPETMQDKNLCGCCKFQSTCKEDMKKIFNEGFKFRTKRRGASLISLMVFFMATIIITSQVFFFSNTSSQSVKEDRDIQSIRMQLASLVENARIEIKTASDDFTVGGTINWENFFDDANADTRKNYTHQYDEGAFHIEKYFYRNDANKMYATIHDLSYTYENKDFDNTNSSHWKDMNQRIFPAMEDHFLIRAYKTMPAGNNFMIQVLVNGNGNIKTYEEIWWQ